MLGKLQSPIQNVMAGPLLFIVKLMGILCFRKKKYIQKNNVMDSIEPIGYFYCLSLTSRKENIQAISLPYQLVVAYF